MDLMLVASALEAAGAAVREPVEEADRGRPLVPALVRTAAGREPEPARVPEAVRTGRDGAEAAGLRGGGVTSSSGPSFESWGAFVEMNEVSMM